MSKFGLDEKQIGLIQNVFLQFPEIKRVIIYGSRAKNKQKQTSDIDLAIEVPNFGMSGILRLKAELNELPLPFDFDVLNITEVQNQKLLKNIKTDGKVFFINLK
jgi:predicted nucleotidyltransferase